MRKKRKGVEFWGVFWGVGMKKRHDDDEAYHEMGLITLFFSHLLFASCLVPFILILNPNCPSLPSFLLTSIPLFLCLIYCLHACTSLSLSFYQQIYCSILILIFHLTHLNFHPSTHNIIYIIYL